MARHAKSKLTVAPERIATVNIVPVLSRHATLVSTELVGDRLVEAHRAAAHLDPQIAPRIDAHRQGGI